jgi:hypothetical protein
VIAQRFECNPMTGWQQADMNYETAGSKISIGSVKY